VNLEGFWLLLSKEGPAAFAPVMLKDQVKSLLPGIPVYGSNKMIDLVTGFCRKKKIPLLGIDPAKQTALMKQRLEAYIKVKDVTGFPVEYRRIKDAGEIELIRKSCKIASETVKQVQGLIRPGMTEEEIGFKIEELFAKNQVRPSFLTIVASGPNSANPHHLGSSRKVQENDTVLMDLGCVYKGYCSDLTRTLYFGKINRLMRKVFSLVQQAHDTAIAHAGPGVKVKDLDKTARRIISSAGYGDAFIHTTGHGIGVEVHEAPRISGKDPAVLAPGMVITIEPGVYLPGQFGVRIEDTILITEKGNEVLTQ
jgi:Xaa-Pro aminopeptidase